MSEIEVNFLNHDKVLSLLKNADTTLQFDCDLALYGEGDPVRAKIVEAARILSSKGARGEYWIAVPSSLLVLFVENNFESNETGFDGVNFVGIWHKRWKVYCDNDLEDSCILIGCGYEDGPPEYYVRVNVQEINTNLFSREQNEEFDDFFSDGQVDEL